ncbi:DUF6415 family natural product biosynthesis protein [Streptomyces sp. NBS 14/10]|uniref:DUF6415 family natural product biosynthesis protein n=1 Tax=Streptomyces sp. NBS 14/10 TaxID=1945643 RepID=UPI0015C64A28|nr:DUF6415 family natural product biosynthesis protein [Streptomyces sp. NBS 14/10]KAK1181550.1 DUF6415 family natural product biosynthesis protein [Streptomyces sp. NBS 14/10]
MSGASRDPRVKRDRIDAAKAERVMRALVGHIETLTPLARKRIDRLNHGTMEWYGKASKLSSIPYEVGTGLGSGLLSAKAHVQGLGYSCRFLLENSGLQAARKG